MKYFATVRVDGWVEVEIEAESEEEAREHISQEVEEMNFGELRGTTLEVVAFAPMAIG